MTRQLIMVGLIVCITACGFHLKGTTLLPAQLKQLKLIESSDDDLNKELTKQLTRAGATFVQDENAALIRVNYQAFPEITIAQSSSSGLQIQLLKITIEYSLRNTKGKWLVNNKQLSQSKEFESDSDQLLAKNKEKKQVYKEMKKSLVQILLYQLQLEN